MLLPSKHIPISDTYLGIGAVILHVLNEPKTARQLWSRLRDTPSVGTYDRFIYSLTMLYMLGLVDIVDGNLIKVSK